MLEAYSRTAVTATPDLVVAHSNAGLVAPAVAAGIPLVFFDATLPPSEGGVTMAPPGMLAHLETLADVGGILPQWTQWFDEADVAGLFPDDATRSGVEAAMPRLPVGYFRTTVPVPRRWERGPCAYLAFGGTYAGELARARTLGWPTEVVDGAGHLHHLHDPGGVVRAILALAGVTSCEA